MSSPENAQPGVQSLIEHPEERADVSLILGYDCADTDGLIEQIESLGATVEERLHYETLAVAIDSRTDLRALCELDAITSVEIEGEWEQLGDESSELAHPTYESAEELQEVLKTSQSKAIDFGAFSDVDGTVTVAVIDSLHDESAATRSEADVIARSMDLLTDCDKEDTTGHGTHVCRVLSGLSNHIEINLYRVVHSGGSVRERRLIEAIGYAHRRDNVDIINLSIGNDHSDDGNGGCTRRNQPCKVRDAVGQAIDDEIPVVAAAGNANQFDSVCCPSLHENAVSVGGFISNCEADIDGTSARPPLACWVPNDDPVLCSDRDCSPHPEDGCQQNRMTENWSGNVEPVWNKPDVLAPAASVIGPDSIVLGTSWAAPVVTAWVAETMLGVRDRGKEPPAYVFRQALENTANELDSGEQLLLDCYGAIQYVYEELDLPRPKRNDSPRFCARDDIGI